MRFFSRFESLVNTEGIQTIRNRRDTYYSLRVLLIRKEFKLTKQENERYNSLRVLLIRKEFKLIGTEKAEKVV